MEDVRSLSSQEFEAEFGAIYRSVFCSQPYGGCPFSPPAWRIVLIPYGSNMSAEDSDALARTAEESGDQDVIVKDAETIRPSEAGVVIPVSGNLFAILRGRSGTNLAIVDVHLFGRSGRWGCICAASLDDIAIVGGDTAFIARLEELAGGAATLRNRFLDFADAEWSVGEDAKSDLLRAARWSGEGT